MEFDRIHFKLTDYLRGTQIIPKCGHVERYKWVTPEPLHVLCSRVCDYLPEETCFKWTNMQVLIWLTSIGFPQYRNTFYANMINGRTLLLVDPSALCAMNVKNFDHIMTIAKAIRDLYQVEKILFQRSISLPPRYPDTHFKLYRICTGPTYQRITRSKLWRRMHIIQDIPSNRNHWRTLHEHLQHKPINQRHRIGYAPRANMMHVRSDPHPTLSRVSSSVRKFANPCHCIPPCECEWAEEFYRDPWTMLCLMGPEAEALRGQLKDGDLVLVADPSPEEPSRVDGTSKVDPETPHSKHSCPCVIPNICQWRATDREPYVLSVVRCCETLMEESVVKIINMHQ